MRRAFASVKKSLPSTEIQKNEQPPEGGEVVEIESPAKREAQDGGKASSDECGRAAVLELEADSFSTCAGEVREDLWIGRRSRDVDPAHAAAARGGEPARCGPT